MSWGTEPGGPVGEIVPIPRWPIRLAKDCLYCDGKEYPITQYPELFEVIGYTFGGAGTMFSVPNLNEGIQKRVIRSGLPVEEV